MSVTKAAPPQRSDEPKKPIDLDDGTRIIFSIGRGFDGSTRERISVMRPDAPQNVIVLDSSNGNRPIHKMRPGLTEQVARALEAKKPAMRAEIGDSHIIVRSRRLTLVQSPTPYTDVEVLDRAGNPIQRPLAAYPVALESLPKLGGLLRDGWAYAGEYQGRHLAVCRPSFGGEPIEWGDAKKGQEGFIGGYSASSNRLSYSSKKPGHDDGQPRLPSFQELQYIVSQKNSFDGRVPSERIWSATRASEQSQTVYGVSGYDGTTVVADTATTIDPIVKVAVGPRARMVNLDVRTLRVFRANSASRSSR